MDDKTLLKEDGALMYVTPFHACTAVDPARRPAGVIDAAMVAAGEDSELVRACKQYAEKHGHTANMPGGYREPGHYYLVPVKRIEPAEGSESGRYTAHSDDPLACRLTGTPRALLARLTEHERVS
jgi:hypothetical protein